MSRRFLTSTGTLAGSPARQPRRGPNAAAALGAPRWSALVVTIAVVLLLAVPVGGQAPTATKGVPSTTGKTTVAAKKSTVPRTPWGDPDLQGVWNIATSTPLQRPAQFGEKLVLTEDEAAEFQEEVAEDLTRDRRDGGNEVDVNRAYNDHWMDARRLKITEDHRTSLIVDPPDGRIPPRVPLSPERQKEAAERAAGNARFLAWMPWSSEELSLPVRCIIRTDLPPYLPTIYNNSFQFFQAAGMVVIAPEMIHSARVIYLDGRPHLGKNLKQWLGDTRGRFEGNTLVVETTNFRSDPGAVYQNGSPDTFKIVERFTRVDGDTINYEFTVSDPKTWTRPWTAMIPMTKVDPDEQMYEYMCHEDNYDIVHLLAGGRKREALGETVDTSRRPGGGGDDR